MARKFSELRAGMRPAAQDQAHERAMQMLLAIPLGELRRAREMTQQELAVLLGTTQANVSQIEKRADVYISTLRRYIEALGGELEITARFPGGELRLLEIADLDRVAEPEEAVA
ncbi:MAG TPA: XRE family transcriptional regulator [Longimicrobium sp.]|nr:XRE family transcriptional regulator [Longimicrobium sp.]